MIKRFIIMQKILLPVVILIGLLAQPVIAANKKTVALLPLAMYADPSKAYLRQGIQSMLLSRLSGEEVEVISGQTLDTRLADQDKNGITTQARAEELARTLQTQYVVFGSFTALGGGYSIDLSILDLTQDPVKLTNFSEPAGEDQFIPRLSEIAYQFRSVIEGREIGPPSQASLTTGAEGDNEGIFKSAISKSRTLNPTGSLPFNLDLMSFSLADLDKDGQTEWLVLTRDNLLIYNHKGDALILKHSLKTVIGESFLKLSIGDFNQNGKPEIFLVSMYGRGARTKIFEWSEGLKKIAQMDAHLRVLKVPDQDKFLVIFQDSAVNRFVYGKIYFMKSGQGDKLTKGDEIKLPKETRFYTLGLIDLTHDGNPEFSGLDGHSNPFICDMGGTIIWNDEETLGGTNNAIRIVQNATEKDELGHHFPFESPMVVMDVDRDGKMELLAVKNILSNELLNTYTVYPTSQLVAYKIEGTTLNRAWVSREIPYCIMDLAIDGKTLYMAVAKKKTTTLSAGSSRVMWFE